MFYDRFKAMDSEIVLAAEGGGAAQGFAEARSSLQDYIQRFSRFLPDSELAQLNRSAGQWFQASPALFSLLEAALECHLATGGLFEPAVLPDLEGLGYNRPLNEVKAGGAVPGRPTQKGPASRRTPFSAVEFDQAACSVRMPPGMRIDLGGIAKGWIAESLAQILAKYSPGCAANAGGDMFLTGLPAGQSAWEIGLEDPANPAQDLTALWVEGGAVATSSVVKRAWIQGDTLRHHLIDPRSGEPARSPWLSVTVFAPHGALAEAFAKAILIGGPEIAQDLCQKYPEISCLAVDPAGSLWTTEKEGAV